MSNWDDHDSDIEDPEPPIRRATRSQHILAAILAASILGSCAAWYLSNEGLSQTGLFFIAIPGFLAMLMTLAPFPEGNSTGFSATRGTTIAILASAIFIREGFICVIMALPLIIPIVAVVVWSVRAASSGRRQAAWLLPLLLVGASGEGVVYELPSNVTVSETRHIDTTSENVLASFAEAGELPELEPLLFKLPFPRPTAFTGTGVDVGDIRTVEFGDMGALTLTITSQSNHHVTWEITKDTTPLSEWMTIHEATANWIETPKGIAFTMEIEFDRALAPAFYFDPLERWGVGEMAEVLTDMVIHNLPAEGETRNAG